MVSWNKYSFILVLLISLLFTGCFGSSWKNTGLLTVEILDGNPATITRELFLREGNGKSSSILIPLGGSSRVSLNVPKGTWDLWVFSRDRDGRVVAEGVEHKIRGGKSTYVIVALRAIYDAPTPPQITEVEWEWDPRGAYIEWAIEGPTYPGDEWQIWRSRSDQNRWFKVGETFGDNLRFVDRQNDTGEFKYGVRFVDSRPGSFAGPLIVGHGPILGGIEISWEFEHYFPPVSQRSLGLAMLPEVALEREFTDLLVHFTSQSAFANRYSLLNAVGLEIKDEIPILSVVVVEPSWNSELSLEEWSTYSGPDFFVEPNWVVQVDKLAIAQTISTQDYLSYLRVPQAQAITKGNHGKRIAVLDTGLNKQVLPSTVQVLPGYNFVRNNHETYDDNHGVYHGSRVARLISEVAPKVSIQPIKVMDSRGEGTAANVAKGLLYAAGIGEPRNSTPAQIINMSLGQIGGSPALEKAIQLVASRTSVMIAASGNDGRPELRYPAAYPDVIAVGGVVSSGYPLRASYSNYGLGLDLVAPVPDCREVGTSFSTPLVSGVAGLMLSNGIPPHQIKAVLIDTAMDLGTPGWDEHHGYGLVNAEWAVQQISSFELMVSDYWTKELVWHEEVPLKGNPIFVSLPPGEYVVEGRLNHFYGKSQVVQVQGEYGKMVHLILRESIN